MGIWLLIAVAEATDCREPGSLVSDAESAVLEARLDDAASALAALDQSLSCSAPAAPEILARMWLAEGAMLVFEGRSDEAVDSFAAARRAAPTVWVAAYGAELRAVYERAGSGGAGSLDLLPTPAEGEGWLDGAATSFPAEVESGLHAVQVVREGRARFGRVIYVAPGDALSVQTNLAATPLPEPVTPQPSAGAHTELSAGPPASPPEHVTGGGRSPWLLVSSGALTAAAVGTAIAARSQSAQMAGSDSRSELNTHFQQQKLWAYTTYGLGGLAVAGVAVHIAL